MAKVASTICTGSLAPESTYEYIVGEEGNRETDVHLHCTPHPVDSRERENKVAGQRMEQSRGGRRRMLMFNSRQAEVEVTTIQTREQYFFLMTVTDEFVTVQIASDHLGCKDNIIIDVVTFRRQVGDH